VILIVAGVAGSGKTTVGALLAGRLRWRFADADTFHPEANVAKMRAGVPLTDEDRAPWLRAVGGWMDTRIAAGQSGVVTCSALKRAYRDQLLAGRPAATMIFLQVSRDVLASRLHSRPGHFFPEKLLESQLADLEPPGQDERVCTVLADGEPEQTAAKIIALLWPDGEPNPEAPPAPGAL
jgi:gluconokinase